MRRPHLVLTHLGGYYGIAVCGLVYLFDDVLWLNVVSLIVVGEGVFFLPLVYLIEQIYEATNGNAIITTEVGQNQMWAAHYYTFTRPRTFISSGGLGTMGYGFKPA